MTTPETKRPRERLLVRMAKILGLAIAVLLVGTLYELIVGHALPFAEFRSGMGYAYLAGLSMVIAFASQADSWEAAAQRAAAVSLVGLVVWLGLGDTTSVFDIVAGLTGVWYTTFIRRV